MADQQRKPMRKLTEYGTQLQEKQKAKRAYGMRESQFRRYFTIASKDKAKTGTTLLRMLERRLDNVVFRAGLALSRAHARQLVNHRHFTVNGRRVNIPSILVKKDDIISPHSNKTVQFHQELVPAEWLKTDKKSLKITVSRLPEESELPVEYDTQKIVEFYSR